jgi:putative CRISPR-associated protein (TIGR02619 family)
MEVTLFVTVGTTAIRHELGTTRDDYSQLQNDIEAFERRADGRAALELPALHADALFVEVSQAHAEVLSLGPVDAESASQISAEMTSTGFLAAHPQAGFGGWFDPARVRIVFLASDTAIGLFCAHVNASLLHQFLCHPQCGCRTRFDDFTNGTTCPAIRVRVVPGMEARRLDTINAHIKQLCQEEADGCKRVMFNITGGYKGAVPAITWLAARLFGQGAELFYQHESALAVTRLSFVERRAGGPLEMGETLWE